MTYVEQLQKRLDSMGATLRGISINPRPGLTAEDVAKTLLDSLDRLEAGDYKPLPPLFDKPELLPV